MKIKQNTYFKILALTLQALNDELYSRQQYYQIKKDSNVIKLLYLALLGSALILSVCALWLAVKEMMTE
ncbi:hypothetical protein D1BOALGB6SA_3647 [Olavius sp. associated proteobacterium Delta 1]|nr:hypothetical protein D1BOALGB6SA_3647 [Olavius sp. associated proteobacterium Delta 1]